MRYWPGLIPHMNSDLSHIKCVCLGLPLILKMSSPNQEERWAWVFNWDWRIFTQKKEWMWSWAYSRHWRDMGSRRIDVGLGPSITLKNVGTKERKNVDPRLFLNTEDAWDQWKERGEPGSLPNTDDALALRRKDVDLTHLYPWRGLSHRNKGMLVWAYQSHWRGLGLKRENVTFCLIRNLKRPRPIEGLWAWVIH